MPAKIFVTLSALIYIGLNPYFEIGATHLFNPDWTAHARLHNAWQLLTHAAFSLLALWLVWIKNAERLASTIALIVSGSFLFAYSIRGLFGGSMQYSDGSELIIFGFNPAISTLLIISAGLIFAIVKSKSSQY